MSNWTYIFIGAGVALIIRILPSLIFSKPITNRFLNSFLYYVPYVTLSLMVFPAILNNNFLAGILALACGILVAYKGGSLLLVASVVSVISLLINLL